MQQEYSVGFEKYSIFTEKCEYQYDFFTAGSVEQAKAECRWKHGDCISIVEVEIF